MKKVLINKISLFVILFFVSANKVLALDEWAAAANDDPAGFGDIEIIFGNILNVILSLAGVAIFVMFIMAGFKFLTAGGNPEQAKSAKSTITWAMIGLVVMLTVWFVMQLIEELTGVTVTNFEVPKP